jgi:predicted RNase H-like HicB family nuclease
MNIRAIVHEAEEGGYWAEVPALPGCVTQGESLGEVRANLREAVELYLEDASSALPTCQNDQILEFAV